MLKYQLTYSFVLLSYNSHTSALLEPLVYTASDFDSIMFYFKSTTKTYS